MFVQLKDFPDYLVTDDGKVISLKFGKWREMKPQPNRGGYYTLVLQIQGKQFNKYLHRLVMEAFAGPSNLEVNHKDGDKANNQITNLEWVTRQGNLKHSAANNLHKHKLTNEQVHQLRALKGVVSPKDAALQFNISVVHVHDIWAGRKRKHA